MSPARFSVVPEWDKYISVPEWGKYIRVTGQGPSVPERDKYIRVTGQGPSMSEWGFLRNHRGQLPDIWQRASVWRTVSCNAVLNLWHVHFLFDATFNI